MAETHSLFLVLLVGKDVRTDVFQHSCRLCSEYLLSVNFTVVIAK